MQGKPLGSPEKKGEDDKEEEEHQEEGEEEEDEEDEYHGRRLNSVEEEDEEVNQILSIISFMYYLASSNKFNLASSNLGLSHFYADEYKI